MSAMRFLTFALSLSLVMPPLGSAWAADAAPSDPPEEKHTLGPLSPDNQRLDDLFARLRKERSTESARALADQIREIQAISNSATVDMLLANAEKAVAEKRFGAALDFLDQVTLLAPDFAEGWNRRATAHFLMGNFPKSMNDIARVLALEPRHLGALAGLAGILEESGRDIQALSAWQAYLAAYPADREAQKQAIELLDKIAGQKT